MGISILELVLRRLREAKFTADVAFPGQKFPQITKPVAAVHIEKVDVTLRAGFDIRHGLIGAGVYASHGYERSHIDGVYNTLKVICGYLDV